MKMRALLSIERVIPRLRAHDKRVALRKLAAHAAADVELSASAIARSLLECADLPAFGPGRGVSLPHAFVPGIGKPIATFARLEPPIDFGAADGSLTDLVALLLSPAESPADHLRALACMARTLRDRNVCNLLRAAESRDALYVILCGPDTPPWSDERERAEARAGLRRSPGDDDRIRLQSLKGDLEMASDGRSKKTSGHQQCAAPRPAKRAP